MHKHLRGYHEQSPVESDQQKRYARWRARDARFVSLDAPDTTYHENITLFFDDSEVNMYQNFRYDLNYFRVQKSSCFYYEFVVLTLLL